MSTSGAVQRHRMEAVVRSWWGPSTSLSNVPRLVTVDRLRELGRVIQRDHGATCIASAQEFQADEKDAAHASTKRAADAEV
jgi:hypothetical protein